MTNETLERNIDQLVTKAHEPPRIDIEARARIFDNLRQRQLERTKAARRRRGWLAGGAAMALSAAAAITWIVVTGSGGVSGLAHANFDASPKVVTLSHGGAQAIMNSGAVMRELGPRELLVYRGEVVLDVEPGRGEYEVHTPHGLVSVLGTRFLIDARDDQTSAAVVRGLVRLENGFGSATLRAGELGVLRDAVGPTREPAPRLSYLTSWAKQARKQLEGRDDSPARNGALLARQPEGWGTNREWPLPMRDLTVDVHVENQVARVAVDQTFFNHVNQNLEGVYQFPLPHDAAISRLAMYVDGKRMESAIVERQRGRQVYESIVYRRRDPALLEWMKGNMFKVRIFPLPARQEKRILLSYTQTLPKLYDGYRVEVPIPEIDDPVRRVKLNVRLDGCADCDVTSSSHAIEVAHEGGDTLVSFSAKDETIGDDLLLRVREPQQRAIRVARNGDDYWMVGVQPDIGGRGEHQRRSWVVLYDTSASRGRLELEAQAYVVDRLLQELDEEDELSIIAFDATTRSMGDFENVIDVDRRTVNGFLREEAGSGVGYTDMDAALGAALKQLEGARAAPHILYVGDGLATGGARDLDDLRSRVRGNATVVAVAVGDKLDATVLRALADETGGLFATMNPGEDLSWRVFDLVATLNTPRIQNLTAAWLDADGQALAAHAYTGRGQLADGEEVVAIGKLQQRPAALKLAGIVAGDTWSQTVRLDEATAGSAGYLPRLWAQRRIDDLILDGAADHQDEITKLGMNNFLMTPYTSLLVLENDAMYEQYKVERDRRKGWAHYDVPAEIPVVHEPLGSGAIGDAIDPSTVLLRTPLPLFYTMQQNQGWGQASLFDGDVRRRSAAFQQPIAGGWLGPVGGESGTGWGFGMGAGRGGGGWRDVGGLVAGNHRIVLDATREENERSEPASGPVAVVTGALTTEDLRGQAGADWFVTTPMHGRFSGVPSVDLARDVRAFDFKTTKAKGKSSDKSSSSTRWSPRRSRRGPAYYWSYGYAPSPILYTWEGDPNLDDLTEFVPALFADSYDVDRMDLMASAGKGSITDEARALVDAARAAIAPQRLTLDGETMSVDAGGRFVIERKTDTELTERTVYDGESLITSYPELDLAVRRPVGDATPALFLSRAPFLLPPADHLARWYTVTKRGDHTLRLGVGDEAKQAYFEVDLDDQHRVVALRGAAGGEAFELLAIEYAPDSITLRVGDSARVLERTALPAALDVSPPDAVVVELPLRQPAHWRNELAGAVAGSEEWVHAQRQILAGYAALIDGNQVWSTLAELAKHTELRRGDLVLGSRASAHAPSNEMQAVIGELPKTDPVARYLAAVHPLRRNGGTAAYDKLAASEKGTLVGMLSSYRSAIRSMRYGNGKAAKRKIDAFLASSDYAPLHYVAAHRFASNYGWTDTKATVAVWEKLAEDPEWSYLARYEAARALLNRGKYADAAERFDALVREALDAGEYPPVDYSVRSAYLSGGRGQAGWRLVWSQWRARVVREQDPEALLWFLTASQNVGEWQDIDRVVAPFRGVELDDVELALDLSDRLIGMGRHDAAWIFLQPFAESDDPRVLARASLVAEQQGRVMDAARYLEQVLASEDPMPLGELRNAYRRLLSLYGKLAHSPSSEGADALAGMLSAAADWRYHDPDNPEIDRLCASTLYAVEQPEQAWRYLSTVIERHPGEGDAYQQAASALENEGRLDEADALWRQAIEVEPTNPNWLLRRAQNLVALGKSEPALELLKKIEKGDWQPRFNNVPWQAESMRKQLE